MRARRFLAVAAVLLACGGDSGTNDDASSPDATVDGATDGTAADASTDVTTSDGATDAGVDAPSGCSARTTSDSTGVFVSTSSGNDTTGCGTRTIPCKTIQRGITEATQGTGKTTVYVASGAYTESVTLAAGLTIEGGWSASGLTWTPICDNTTSTAVSIQGVTNTTVTASYNGSSTLRFVSVTSKASADPGESLYGVFATGSSTDLTLDQIAVSVGTGGVGNDGTSGSSGTSATDAGCTASNGANGAPGASGVGGDGGAFSATGYAGSDGTGGAPGAAGHAGTAGGNGACGTCDGFGGSCPNSCGFTSGQKCATNGLAGCGGAAGTGGTQGIAGGASIAVFAWDAHVTILGGSYATGNGGNGGGGGLGADGGTGSAGAPGTTAACPTQLSNPQCIVNFCSGTLVSEYTLDAGTAGGSGGAGGPGAQGGGGSGGWSYAIVQGGDGGVSLDGGTLAHGDAGSGGVLGGADGLAGDRWP